MMELSVPRPTLKFERVAGTVSLADLCSMIVSLEPTDDRRVSSQVLALRMN